MLGATHIAEQFDEVRDRVTSSLAYGLLPVPSVSSLPDGGAIATAWSTAARAEETEYPVTEPES